jgi:hypothetical protein
MVRILAISLLIMAGSAAAQSVPATAPASDLSWLHGDWNGTGAVFGAPSQATLNAGPALEGKFVELHYRFTTSGQRAFVFEGRGFYSVADWRGQWFDSTGESRPLIGTIADGELSSEWGDTGSERGRSQYRRGADGTLEVIDQVQRADGQWHVFATHRFVRAQGQDSSETP